MAGNDLWQATMMFGSVGRNVVMPEVQAQAGIREPRRSHLDVIRSYFN